MTMRIAAALLVAMLGLAACEDDGASVRDLGGSASSGSGSGSGSATGAGSGSGTGVTGGECEEAGGEPGLVVALDEWSVVPGEEKLVSGPVRILAANRGEIAHELYIAQAPNLESLPLDGDHGVDEDALRPDQLVGAIEEVPPGETCALEVDLEPAAYVLFCNIADEGESQVRSHFLRGMRARVKVS